MAPPSVDLSIYGIHVKQVLRNPAPARLYEEAVQHDGCHIASSGALIARSGKRTGRSPADKRIVETDDVKNDVWWGEVNIPLDGHTFLVNRQRAVDFLNTRSRLFVIDAYAGWDPRYRLKVRVICARPYHALFMHTMLIRPTPEQLADFGEPDFVVFNAGPFPANPYTPGMTSTTSVDICFQHRQLVILGTEYAGEMKKGIFTVMHYLMPKQGVLSMHCSANEGQQGDVTLFFGLSGTGKTTLSSDPRRRLIGDDEHCWTDHGVFNIEGGCYAKCLGLDPEKEPLIYQAIRFGTVLENVVFDPETHQVDFNSDAITQNTRAAYPLEFIPGVKLPAVGDHPRNIIFLTCDAFGVMPPVARLTPEQAMYHFISGYTAKVAGTEVGVKEPVATFSTCYSAPFLVWHPTRYVEMLAQKMRAHGTQAWLVNTGWIGGPYGQGRRISIPHTRAIIDAIHSGQAAQAPVEQEPVFGLYVPKQLPGVPEEILLPRRAWPDPEQYDRQAAQLAARFHENFQQYADLASEEIKSAGPLVGAAT